MKARCDWCGMEVEVMASGRCLLGHPITGLVADEKPASEPETASFPPPRDLAPRRRARTKPPPPPENLPRSIRAAPTPERTPPSLPDAPAAAPPPVARSEPAPVSEPGDAEEKDPLPVVPRISRPWAPVEPDGPSGPVGAEDPWLESERFKALASDPVKDPAPAEEPGAGAGPLETALREMLAGERDRDKAAAEAPQAPARQPGPRPAPTLPAAATARADEQKPKRLRLPFRSRPERRPPVDRPAEGTPVRTLKAVPKLPVPEKPAPAPKRPAPDRSPAPLLEAIITGSPAKEKTPDPKPKPKAPAAQPLPAAKAPEPKTPEPHAEAEPRGIAPGTRNPPPAPVSRRLTAPTPRNTVAWGLAIAATFVAGIAALVLSPSRAEDNRPTVRRIALTDVTGHTVQHDPETESRLRAELGAQRAVPRQLYAATIRNQDGDIVALYQAIVFGDDVAATQRDTDDFIALFAEGAGVSADSFAERPLGDRRIWSGLLDQGQAILQFRGPEVVIVITAATGADGDKLADAILTARGI